ncbi:bifunctional oligoribonuclease/PAP phosphatase NrnA [bacterium]|nr:bifunctional oligoribonuclease/PAP phosphatase NrnA [bacterium]
MLSAEILERIRSGNSFWVATHIDPDGDAIGSVLLVGRLLRHLGKKYAIYLCDPVPHKFEFLAGVEEITNKEPDFKPDTFITVDLPDLVRLGYTPPQSQIINIDHHPSNEDYGDYNWIDVNRTAACVMVLELLKSVDFPLGRQEGEMVFTGIYTETGGFSYPNVSTEVFLVSADILELGVNAADIALRMTARDERNLALLGKVLATLRIEDTVATIELTENMLKELEINRADQDSDSFIRYPVSIPGVRIAIFFRENPTSGEVRMSFRSLTGVDVNQLAARFGGGGHQNAAGARVRGDYKEVKKRVLEEAKGYLSCAEA